MSFYDSLLSVFSTVATAAVSLTQSEPDSSGLSDYPSTGAKIWPLSAVMREEMKKGVVYNMKVVLRGMRGTGKTTLLSRLSGHPMPTAYKPSQEISATTIRFCGRGCQPHEGTRVDIWDVVDDGGRGSDSHPTPPLPSGHKNQDMLRHQLELLGTVADAQTVDVYRGCQLAVFLVHPARPASLQYAVREAAAVPYHTCIVFALNFADTREQEQPRRGTVSVADVAAACRPLRRATTPFVCDLMQGRPPVPEFSAPAMVVSISAATGLGLPQLVDAFNVPNTLLRLAVFEQRARAMYVDVRRIADRFTAGEVEDPPVAVHLAGLPPLTTLHVLTTLPTSHGATPLLNGYSQVGETSAAASRMLVAPEPASTRSDRTSELKLANAPATAAAPHSKELDERGIQVGFFDDVDDDDDDDSPSAAASGSSDNDGPPPVSHRGRGGRRRAMVKPLGPGRPATKATGSSATVSPPGAAAAPPVPDDPSWPTDVPPAALPPIVSPVLVVIDDPTALQLAADEAAAEKAAAVDAILVAAMADTHGPGDDFFSALDDAATARDSPHGETGKGEVDPPSPPPPPAAHRAARPLATQRAQRRPLASEEVKPRASIDNSGKAPVVAVDVGAMLAAMQAALSVPEFDAAGPPADKMD